MLRDERTNVLVWSEGTAPDDVYPNDINGAVAAHLNEHRDIVARAVSIDEADQGVGADRLAWADTVAWWGHLRHDDVTDATVDRVEAAVREDGVGFVGLHSGHYARPFTRLIDASGDLDEVRTVAGETERFEVRAPDHPVAEGVEPFALPDVEMFGESFDIPDPEAVVLHSTFSDGGEFRSCVTFALGAGRGVYFRPGHEEFRIYHDENVRTVLANAVRWAGGD